MHLRTRHRETSSSNDGENLWRPVVLAAGCPGNPPIAIRIYHTICESFLKERDRWFLWCPVFLGFGIALYFSLLNEPSWIIGAAAIILALAGVVVSFGRAGAPAFMALLIVIAGFNLALLRTWTLDTPILGEKGRGALTGTVSRIDDRPDGQRVTLRDARFSPRYGRTDPAHLAGVRVKLRKSEIILSIGQVIKLDAVLRPPSPPVMPGSFDFQRHAYFNGIGASGYALSKAVVLAQGKRASVLGRLGDKITAVRLAFSRSVKSQVSGQEGAVASALLTGDRSGLSKETLADMRRAGLAHLLAISGLHMGLIAGFAFFASRLLLSAVQSVSLRFNVKKIAAGLSLLSALAYLLMSGGTVPTQRAFLMTGAVLIGVLIDRRVISMRTVAAAAMLILVFRPEAMLGASFQLSFAAAVALVAFYEAGRLKPSPVRSSGVYSALRWAGVYVLALLASSLIANLATAPFAAYHFNTVSISGIAANMAAIPITGFWVMPWGFLATALAPVGAEYVPLKAMSFGIETVLSVARYFAGLDWAILPVRNIPAAAMVCAVLGGCWLCIWRTSWRWWSMALIAVAAGMAGVSRQPDILIALDTGIAAVRMDGGHDEALFVSNGRGRFERAIWKRRLGLEKVAERNHTRVIRQSDYCDAVGCTVTRNGYIVALSGSPESLAEDCARADIVVSFQRNYANCLSPIAFFDLQRLKSGAIYAIWLDDPKVRIQNVVSSRGQRPWVSIWKPLGVKDL